MSGASDMLPSAGSWGPRPSVLLTKWGEFFLKESSQDFEVSTRADIKGGGSPKLGVDTLRFQLGFFSKFRALE